MSGVFIRPFLAGDVVQLQLQPSQQVTMGMLRPAHSLEDGRELEEGGEAWTFISREGRVLACAGLAMLWPAGPKTGGHAVAWALLSEKLGAAHLSITRFLKQRIAECEPTRIEMIVRADVKAEARWPVLLGMTLACELPAYGAEAGDFLLFHRIKPVGDR